MIEGQYTASVRLSLASQGAGQSHSKHVYHSYAVSTLFHTQASEDASHLAVSHAAHSALMS